MKWITRQFAKVDRIACPWLIKHFVDPAAEFVFLPADTDWQAVTDGIVFDVPECSFDAIIAKYQLGGGTQRSGVETPFSLTSHHPLSDACSSTCTANRQVTEV